MAHCQPLNERIDLTPHCDAPVLACRGTVYEVLRARGESDLVAGSFAFNPPAAQRAGAPVTARQLHAFYDHGPAGLDSGVAT